MRGEVYVRTFPDGNEVTFLRMSRPARCRPVALALQLQVLAAPAERVAQLLAERVHELVAVGGVDAGS